MCRLYDRFGKFDGFRMYHALSLNGNSKIINAVKRQRNLGLDHDVPPEVLDVINVMWYVCLRFDISALLQVKSQNYASICVAWNCHVEILQNVYYNACIWQLLWFKFCCCICQYITYITHNKICPLTWHVSSQHHQTSTTKLAMQLNKYFAWFVIYSRRTIWMDGWDHRKATHYSIHFPSAKVIVHDTKQDVVVGVFEYDLGFDIHVWFCLSLFIISYFGKGLPSRSCVKL